MPSGGYFNGAGTCTDGGDNCCNCCCCSPWFSSFDFLYMGRNPPNTLYMSYEFSAPVKPGTLRQLRLGARRTGHFRLPLRLLL